MRKNFLILMLMAFVSMAAFAETDISTSTKIQMSTGNVTYGGTDAPTIQLLDEGYKMTTADDYTWDGKYYTTEACTTEATGTISSLTAGTYWVQVEGKGVYTGKKAQSFEVKKKEVSVAVSGSFSKTYGAADPALTSDDLDWSSATGFVSSDDKSVFTGTLTYTYEGTNVGTYPVTVSGMTADNYTLTITGGITINAKPITAEMITNVTLSEPYKGAAYDEFAVDVKDGSTVLVAGTDFEVKAYDGAITGTAVSPTDVKTYNLGISQKAGANYSVSTTLAAGTFAITKVGLTIRALPQSRYYTGNNGLPSTAEGTAYEVLGKIGSDAIGNVSLTVEDEDAAVGEYTVTPSATGTNENYDYNYVPATFTINKRPLTITATDFAKVYGQADNAASGYNATYGYGGLTITPTLDEANGETTWTVPSGSGKDLQLMQNTYATTNNTTKKNGSLRVVRSGMGTDENKDTYEDALTISYAAAGTVWNNYAVTTVAGDFEITGGKIYITALNQEKNYGDDDPSWTASKDVNYIVTGLSGDDALTTEPTLVRAEGEDVGEFDITISGAVAPAGYEAIVYAKGTFTIKPRPLKVTAKVQTLKKDQTVAALDQTAFEIDESTTLNGDDTAADVFSLAFATTASTDPVVQVPAVDSDGKLTATTRTTYTGGITYKNGTKAGNYNITFTNGDLIVVPADAVVLNDATDLSALTAATADQTVTFTSRELTAEVWESMVLPFDATVRKISNAFGYAVVDMFIEDATSEDMNFKIAMGEIPAYTPFLVKVDANINMNTVVFDGVRIKAKIADNLTKSNKSYNFIGKLDNEAIDTDFWAIGSKMTKDTFKFNKYKSGTSLKALRAYITAKEGVTAAPNIYIEEPDGSTTAIKGITAEGQAIAADGWYTLSGIRLEGAPTEKGIYVRNGKKVVIK